MYTLRAEPEDFRVEEVPLYPAAGHGDHTFVRVCKRLRTTEEVARDLARAAGVAPRDVGYAGRKDRRAVAIQWLSVPGLDPERALALELPGVRVLEAARHPHKLRTGHLAANRFELCVRGVDAGAWERGSARLEGIRRRGMPNRFGPQRFGRDGDNAERALALLRDPEEGVPRRRRREARFLLSALQARVFNAVLDARPLPPERLEAGDVAVRHDSGGLFLVEDPEAEAARAEAFEISPTGPIFGHRSTRPAGEVARREREVALRHGVDPDALPRLAGVTLRGARRALRVRLAELEAEHEGEVLRLRFALPSGSYATVLVDALLGAPGALSDDGDDSDDRGRDATVC